MGRKVKLVVFDNDLRATVKKYPVSDSGDRIRVTKGGEAHFMPAFDKDTFLEMPKKLGGTERVYFARKLAKECVNFSSGIVPGPSPEEQKKAIGSTLLNQVGKPEKTGPQWWDIIVIFIVIITLLNVMGVW